MAKIKRFGVIKTACFLGLYGFFIGVLADIFFLITSVILKTVASGLDTSVFTSMFGFSGLLGIILIPFIYGIISFLAGLIFTPVMNLILKMINGLDWDIEMQPEITSETPRQNLEYSQDNQR